MPISPLTPRDTVERLTDYSAECLTKSASSCACEGLYAASPIASAPQGNPPLFSSCARPDRPFSCRATLPFPDASAYPRPCLHESAHDTLARSSPSPSPSPSPSRTFECFQADRFVQPKPLSFIDPFDWAIRLYF
ncbi:hypothetical protein P3342_006982 [Pyrenophora teres f. teres]|nr:hypothetical protein P3342_006982 [Pyrenophora teres f. teres]